MQTEARSKIDQIYSGLKSRIDTMSKGDRFLSVREVMNEYRVSQVTVDKAMMKLADEGLLIKTPKVGTFVSEPGHKGAQTRQRKLAIAIPDYPSSFYEIYLTSFPAVIQNKGYKSEIIRYDLRDRVPKTLPNRDVDGLIVIPASVRLTSEDLYTVSQFKIPTVFISRLFHGLAVDCVDTDNEQGGDIAVDHLIGLGHQKLAILVSEPSCAAVDQRIKGFSQKAQMMGISEVELIDCNITHGELAAPKAYNALLNHVKKNGVTFTGLFVLSDASALGALKALHDLKISIPEEVSVVGFDDVPESQFYYPSLTTVRGDYNGVSKTAVDIIERRLDGDKEDAIQIAVDSHLVVRESTKQID